MHDVGNTQVTSFGFIFKKNHIFFIKLTSQHYQIKSTFGDLSLNEVVFIVQDSVLDLNKISQQLQERGKIIPNIHHTLNKQRVRIHLNKAR